MKEDSIVEQRIKAAMAAGAFDNLRGAGEPLPPDDASHVPDELRPAYRLLKNAGFVPPEVAHRKSIAALECMLADDTCVNAEQRTRAISRLALLRAHHEKRHGACGGLAVAEYQARLVTRPGSS